MAKRSYSDVRRAENRRGMTLKRRRIDGGEDNVSFCTDNHAPNEDQSSIAPLHLGPAGSQLVEPSTSKFSFRFGSDDEDGGESGDGKDVPVACLDEYATVDDLPSYEEMIGDLYDNVAPEPVDQPIEDHEVDEFEFVRLMLEDKEESSDKDYEELVDYWDIFNQSDDDDEGYGTDSETEGDMEVEDEVQTEDEARDVDDGYATDDEDVEEADDILNEYDDGSDYDDDQGGQAYGNDRVDEADDILNEYDDGSEYDDDEGGHDYGYITQDDAGDAPYLINYQVYLL